MSPSLLLQRDPYLALALPVAEDQAREADGLVLDAVVTATESAQEELRRMLCLSPYVMSWGRGLWLINLKPCADYWHSRGDATDFRLWLQRFLVEQYGHGVSAVLASHPWRALLGVAAMGARGLSGLLLMSEGFGKALLEDLPWPIWWRMIDDLIPHLVRARAPQWKERIFRPQCLRLRRAADQLGFKSAGFLREIPPLALRRRFGPTLAEIGEWTYPQSLETDGLGQLPLALEAALDDGFPWSYSVLHDPPQISRHLDQALGEWSSMEDLVREDLDRLCRVASWSKGEHVVSLEWRLTLLDLTVIPIIISFRHPHDLHKEQGYHKTALLQMGYALEKRGTPSCPAPESGFHYEILPTQWAIVGWDLVITARLSRPKQMMSLFGDLENADVAHDLRQETSLLRLENKLSIPLQGFVLASDWLPEHSFLSGEAGGVSDRGGFDQVTYQAHACSLLISARQRPLFFYKEPQALSGRQKGFFIERTMDKWWRASPCLNQGRRLQRDYFGLTDARQRRLWVYLDQRGHWLVQGIYS